MGPKVSWISFSLLSWQLSVLVGFGHSGDVLDRFVGARVLLMDLSSLLHEQLVFLRSCLSETILDPHCYVRSAIVDGWALSWMPYTLILVAYLLLPAILTWLSWRRAVDVLYAIETAWNRYHLEERVRVARILYQRRQAKAEALRQQRGRLAWQLLQQELRERGLIDEVAASPSVGTGLPEDGNQHCAAMFSLIKNSTHCLFAKASQVLYAADWHPSLSLEENFLRSVPGLLTLSLDGEAAQLDGMVFYCPGEYGATVTALGDTMNRLLHLLNNYDPSARNVMHDPQLGRRGWKFHFNQTNFFITSFGPCYGPAHPRFSFGQDEWAFILFQPEFSFSRHQIGDLHSDIRVKIREAFAAHQRPFWCPRSPISFPFVWNFVAPSHPLDPLVLQRGPPDQWWTRAPAGLPLHPRYTLDIGKAGTGA
jgi:hypothetical protein